MCLLGTARGWRTGTAIATMHLLRWGARWAGQVCKQMVRTDAVSHPLRSTLTTAPEPMAAPDTLALGQHAVRLGLPGADRQHR